MPDETHLAVPAIPPPPTLSPRTSSSSAISRISRRSHLGSRRQHKAKQRNVSIKFSAKNFVRPRQLGEDVEQYYDIEDKIGEGGFGEVFRAIHKKTGAERAVKVIYKTEDSDIDFEKVNTTIRNEFAVVKSLDHVSFMESRLSFVARYIIFIHRYFVG